MKPSKGFEELKKLVIDQNICSGCSTCAAFCERIEMRNDKPELVKDCTMKIGAVKCGMDGACYDTCPMVSFSVAQLEKDIFGEERKDRELGCYKKIVAVKSKKKIEKSQDGGAVTSLLLFALETGYVDAAVVANSNEEWNPAASVAKTGEAILSAAGTKYARAPATMVFGRSFKDVRRIALVGTGCQTNGARRVQAAFLKPVLEKMKSSENPPNILLIGLFCFENFPYECLKNFIEKNYGVKMGDIAKTDIKKGKFIVKTKDGRTLEKKVKEFDECVPDSCKLCTNFTAEFADISVGGVGSEAGWSAVIVRSDKGLELLEKAKEQGYIEVSESVDVAQIKKNVSLKQDKRKAAGEKRAREGQYVPVYE